MSEQQKNNPLHGIKLKDLVTELVDHYGFEILAEQININCFKQNPSINSSLKFLRKTQWARDKVEAFYLYRYKQLPKPTDDQHELPPRDRLISDELISGNPAEIQLGDKEFFDDPVSGAKPFNKIKQSRSQMNKAKPARDASQHSDGTQSNDKAVADPWSKWRTKED